MGWSEYVEPVLSQPQPEELFYALPPYGMGFNAEASPQSFSCDNVAAGPNKKVKKAAVGGFPPLL